MYTHNAIHKLLHKMPPAYTTQALITIIFFFRKLSLFAVMLHKIQRHKLMKVHYQSSETS